MPTCSITLANREELAKYAGQMGLRRCVEVGVWDGKYSEMLCRHIPDIELFCIDTWKISRNHRDQNKVDKAYQDARAKLKYYNVVFMKMESVEAAKKIPCGALDFVYLDALHDYDNVKADLEAWEPRVRAGGIMAGHDWTHPGVTKAVIDFTIKNKIKNIETTKAVESDWLPSWYWIKNA